MHNILSKIKQLDSDTITLVRKLEESMQLNNKLLIENNRLKEELESMKSKLDSDVSDNKDIESIPLERDLKYSKIKEDLEKCIDEVDELVQMIEKK
mgnify:CR=1 FL=1